MEAGGEQSARNRPNGDLRKRWIDAPTTSADSTGRKEGDYIIEARGSPSAETHLLGTFYYYRKSDDELGGIVDIQLKIYDTTNVRVVDTSIMPLQVSVHLQSTLYAMAEKAADLIKAAQ
ncbi:hypothetical protein FB451DRAFT_1404659 [Mycena latifolia]|nr:hypothetical protein FB451DRAFT_1404659 [Mycena latifolia]